MERSPSLNEALPYPSSSSKPRARRVLNWLRPFAEQLLLVHRIQKTCLILPPAEANTAIEARMLKALQVSIQVDERELETVPSRGPLLVVANHPFGALDGLALAAMLHTVRPDFKIMVNHFLRHLPVPELQDRLIHVDPFGRPSSIHANIRPLRQALQWARGGKALVVFPAGEVSHLQWCEGGVTDPAWSETVARIVRRTGATVLPVYFEGANSALFQLLGMIHPCLRTLLLPREVFKKRSQTLTMRIGKPIGFDKLRRFDHDSTMTQYLRLKTYLLRTRKEEPQRSKTAPLKSLDPPTPPPIAPPVSSHRVARDIEALAPDRLLVDTPRFAVYCASSGEIPILLHEIGRLREITFRHAGEGTGAERDLDRFDSHYTHLFLWSKEDREIAGGYRLGLTGEIIDPKGPEGFYTHTLFDYGRELLDHIQPAIELGRSFVVPKHQKSYQPLMLLWRGIGEFIASRPEYRTLFGPVSIHNGYHALSRELIVNYCRRRRPSYLAGLVQPRHPLRSGKRKAREMDAACRLIEDVQDLSELVSDIEPDRKGIPILLKHYMKLGGEFLGFSTDPHFSSVLDALVLVDLMHTDPKILERYMGKPNAIGFRRYHMERRGELLCCA